MKEKLKKELDSLAVSILQTSAEDFKLLYERGRELYEKLAVLNYMNSTIPVQGNENTGAKAEIADRFEKLANAILDENANVPESNPHEEDIIIPGMDTIKDIVAEMPVEETMDDLLVDFQSEPEFVKRETNGADATDTTALIKNKNDVLQTRITVGLNDRIAFVKHLFDGNTEDFNRVVSQLNTTSSAVEAVDFVTNMIKPEYNNWLGKEDYEERFLGMIERGFS